MSEIYEVVGIAEGAVSHIVVAGGLVSLCGVAGWKWLRRRYFLQRQVNCKDCRNEYLEAHDKERLR